MAEGTFNLGDYELTDDSNGNLVIKDPNGNTIDSTIAGIQDDPSNRPLVSTSNRTITVGTDVSTVQEAFDELPRFLRHDWTIDINGDRSSEHPHLTGVYALDAADGTEGAANQLTIDGGTLASLFVSNCYGNRWLTIGCDVDGDVTSGTGNRPDESYGMHFQGVTGVQVFAASFGANCTNGLMAYQSTVKIDGGSTTPTDFGSGNVDNAIGAKASGRVRIRGNGATGTANAAAHRAFSGFIEAERSGNNVTGSPDFQADQGYVIDDSGVFHGVSEFAGQAVENIRGSNGTSISASDGTWDSPTTTDVTETFARTFDSAPSAIAGINIGNTNAGTGIRAEVVSTTTTDVTIRLMNYSSTSSSTQEYEIIAVGSRPN